MFPFVTVLLALALAQPLQQSPIPASQAVEVSLVANTEAGVATRHGWQKVEEALSAKGVRYEKVAALADAHGKSIIVAGLADGPVSQQLRSLEISIPEKPESLVIHKSVTAGKQTLLLAGRDDRGLMYALLEVADRIGWAKDKSAILTEVKDTVESPDVVDRGVTIFTMQKHQYEDRLHDENYWKKYFDMLASDRFNTIEVKFAYEANGYNCPVYPYYIDINGFPGIKVSGLSKDEQQQNRRDLHRLVRLAHERGIRVQFGIWCHYNRFTPTFESFDHTKETPHTVTGLTETNLISYTLTAIKQFLREFNEIDSVQLLMMDESGLKTEDMKEFWKNIYPALKEAGPNLQYEIRAKGVSEDLIKQGLDLGLKIRVNTKVWEEQVGPPFFQTHLQELDQFNRRGSYADMLRYPRNYKLHWTLWTAGTTRVLLWGSPNYVRRFAQETHLGDADGFDIYEPLATKMAGHSHDLEPFELLAPKYRYYDYEFERYWYFFKLFGRLTYNPKTNSDEWEHEFLARFGAGSASYVQAALQRASSILPEIVAYCRPDEHYATTRGWPERQSEGSLAEYIEATPSDTEQFESMQDAAADVLDGRHSAKITPAETSAWFAQAACDVRDLIAKAEQNAGPHPGKEFASTIVDLKILADLAEYHSRRALAGFSMALYQKSHDANMLEDAIQHESKAVDAWSKIVRDAGDVYAFDLMMGLPQYDLSGHWRDELVKLKSGLEALKKQRQEYKLTARRVVGRYYLGKSQPEPGYQRITASTTPALSERAGTGLVVIDVPNGRYQITVKARDENASHGPMWIELNGVDYSDMFSVPAGHTVERTMETTAVEGKLKLLFDHATSADWYVSTIEIAQVDPLIAHAPARRIAPGASLDIRATVAASDAIKSVQAIVGSQSLGYRTITLQSDGPIYRTAIPASALKPGTAYFLQAVDSAGRSSTYPADGRLHPIKVEVTSDDQPPTLQHQPVRLAEAAQPLRIAAQVQDSSGVRWVHLRYRGLSEHQDYKTLNMLPVNGSGSFETTIPAIDVDPHFDLQYFFEVMDNAGNGRIYPDMDKETPYITVKVK
jgi:hypothetical protein